MSKLDQIAMDGPFEIEVKVHFTDGNGQDGAVTFTLPKGTIPAKEAIDNAIKESALAAKGHGLRLMTREEVMSNWLASPVPVAVPGPKDWTAEQKKAWGL